MNETIPKLITVGVIAKEVTQPLHRVLHILRTRPDIKPVARAGNLRLFSESAIPRVRYEIQLVDARCAAQRTNQHAEASA